MGRFRLCPKTQDGFKPSPHHKSPRGTAPPIVEVREQQGQLEKGSSCRGNRPIFQEW